MSDFAMEIIDNKQEKQLHFAMFPMFAMGHITAYMHLSNKLAEQGHRVSFFLPPKTNPFISTLNSHHDLISLINVQIPQVPGLDPNIQTNADSSDFHIHHLLAIAFDRTAPFIESLLDTLRPDFIFYDFAYWVPQIANRLGLLAVCFFTVNSATIAHLLIPDRGLVYSETEFCSVPEDFPHPCVALRKYEAKGVARYESAEFGEGGTFRERLLNAVKNSNALVFKTCREMEGHYLDYIKKQINKPVITAGPTIPMLPSTPLKEDVATWLSKFKPKSVLYCAFGSEWRLPINLFQEVVLGIELTGLPFLIALKPPTDVESIEMALPDGFKDRTLERGLVTDEWVQQLQILGHESVGYFMTHCGSGSLTEGMISECQLVLLPVAVEQNINARVMGRDLKVGVEVELGEEDGLFDRHGVYKAVKDVMNTDDGVGKEVKMNHAKWRKLLLSPGFEKSCVEELVMNLKQLTLNNVE